MEAFGKTVALQTYLHFSTVSELDSGSREAIDRAAGLAKIRGGDDFNVVKLGRDRNTLGLLDYPDFFEAAFPVLRCCWTVDLEAATVRFRTYADSLNPPILHRKELLLPSSHPRQAEFRDLTRAAEDLGLFDDPRRIGFKQAWDTLLTRRGYRVAGHQLLPIGNDESVAGDAGEAFGIARHLTALTRYGFSAPIQTLARFGLLDGSKTVFDYGCGRGDDLRGLRENGIAAHGWDPYYVPDEIRRPAHIVNLGFVINVIEDPAERREALLGAFGLAQELLVVSAMIANPESVRGRPYGDGILTARNTFQKYYGQGELRAWLAEALDLDPVPVGPGIFYVFKDKDAEQRFLLGRQRNRRTVLRLARLSRPERPVRPDKAEARYREHRDLLERLWETRLVLGRDPERGELADGEQIARHFGSPAAALRFLKSRKDGAEAILEQARAARRDDLRVYFADWQFQRRTPYRHLEAGLQRDIKAFFGDYRAALEAGRELLFAAGRSEAIASACREAAERGIGWLEEGHSLQLHTSLVPGLPPVLRAYVASGLRRVKLKLREQDLDLFDYGEDYEPPYLYRKSRFINEEFPHYAEQLAFEEALENLERFDLSGYGPKPAAFRAGLGAARWAVDGFRLVRSQTIPDLDAPCGRHFTYRQLVHCGETQARTGLPNLPREPDSYTALYELAARILDPVIDWFGMIRLTYGFCSPELAPHIPARIAPELDQHAAHERNRRGRPICRRLGAAVDFIVEDEDMAEVARWIMANLPYDRLYFYGKDRPIHVSGSERPAGEAYELREVGGRRVPRRFGG